jgi:hypothetical protein
MFSCVEVEAVDVVDVERERHVGSDLRSNVSDPARSTQWDDDFFGAGRNRPAGLVGVRSGLLQHRDGGEWSAIQQVGHVAGIRWIYGDRRWRADERCG